MHIIHQLDIITIIATGLLIGNELTVSLFINPAVWQLEPSTQAKLFSLLAKSLGHAMPFWYAACLILLLAETVLRRSEPAFHLLLASTIIWAAVIVFTIFLLVPINNRIAALDSTSQFSSWITEHHRWDRLHRLRIVSLLVAMVLHTHALLSPK